MTNDNKPSRRAVLGLLGGAGLLAAAPGLAAFLSGCGKKEAHVVGGKLDVAAFDPLKTYPYRGWESLYREQFT
jgi:hypothetical protein